MLSVENLDNKIKEVWPKNGPPTQEINKYVKKYLKEKNIKNHICPRSVNKLEQKLKDELFCENQNRRSQIEGRIGILKQNFFGKPFRSKRFKSRTKNVAWSILAHNLWVIARLKTYFY